MTVSVSKHDFISRPRHVLLCFHGFLGLLQHIKLKIGSHVTIFILVSDLLGHVAPNQHAESDGADNFLSGDPVFLIDQEKALSQAQVRSNHFSECSGKQSGQV